MKRNNFISNISIH